MNKMFSRREKEASEGVKSLASHIKLENGIAISELIMGIIRVYLSHGNISLPHPEKFFFWGEEAREGGSLNRRRSFEG